MSETDSTRVAPQAGWYLDPGASGALRWWTGASWTEHLAPLPLAPMPLDGPVTAPTPTPVSAPSPAAATPRIAEPSPIVEPSYEPPVKPNANTLPVWLTASVIAAAVGVQGAATAQQLEFPAVVATGISLGIVTALIGLAIWDHSVLESRGLKAASAWWVLLVPPIAYLIARRVALKRLGIRANAPSNVYVLTAVAAALLASLAFAPMASARLDAASLQLLERQASTELQRETSTSWTVRCPAGAAVSTVGSSFDCSATDQTGRSVKFTAHVVSPRRFDVGAAQQQ